MDITEQKDQLQNAIEDCNIRIRHAEDLACEAGCLVTQITNLTFQSRELSIARTHIETGMMWLKADAEAAEEAKSGFCNKLAKL